jgi:hypothetical protein
MMGADRFLFEQHPEAHNPVGCEDPHIFFANSLPLPTVYAACSSPAQSLGSLMAYQSDSCSSVGKRERERQVTWCSRRHSSHE